MRILFFAAALIAAPAAFAQSPSPEGLALGSELARQGLLGTLLPMVEQKETEEMVTAHPELSEADRATLRATAAETARTLSARVIAAQGRVYAETLSLADLKALTAFNRTAAAARFKAAQPQVIAGTMKAMEGADLKNATMAAFCARTGKGCAKD